MKKYTIGLITGALLAVSAMMFMGSQNKNLGDITVNSIIVKDNGNGGFITTYNADGIQTAFLGTSESGSGFILTNNKHEVRTGYFGTGKKEDGLWTLWYENGQKQWEGTYKDGEGISSKCWDEEGNECECGENWREGCD